MKRCVVIVSPYFPPSQLAGVHRARHLGKHLPAHGWQPVVLCVDEAYHEQRLDPALSRLVPAALEIVKVPALPARLTRPIGLGDIALRAWRPLRRRLMELLRSRPVDAVLITAAPYYSLLQAPMIKRRFGIPVVLDFQDPWVSRWGAAQCSLSKAGLSHRLATWLEPRALHAADFVTSVSDVQNEEMATRYPWLDRSRMAALPIGGDPADFEHIRDARPARGVALCEGGRIELSYVGSYWPALNGPLTTLLRSLARLQATDPALARRLRLNFIGTDPTSNGARCQVQPMAEAEGVGELVREIPRRQPYLDALRVMALSDGLLLIGSDEPHYTASKIYPALMSGRPYVSLFHAASSAHAVLQSAGGGVALSFHDARSMAGCEAPLAEALRTLAASPETLSRSDPAAYAPFEARAIAERYAEIFERICPHCASPS